MSKLAIGNSFFGSFRALASFVQNKWVGRVIFLALGCMAIAAIALVGAWLVRDQYKFVWNLSESLPQHFYMIEIGTTPKKGDFIAFKWSKDDTTPMNPYPYGTIFVKQLEGVPGDVVVQNNREFSIDGKSLGVAKVYSKKGQPLDIGPTGLIPVGSYYVRGTHKDSLDSRYSLLGLVKSEDVIGRAIAIF